MAAWPHGDPSVVVRAILATAPYRHARAVTSEPGPSLWDLVRTWLHDHVWEPLRNIFHGLHLYNGHETAGNAGTVLVYLLLGLSAAVLIFASYRLVIAFSRPGEARAGRYGETGFAANELPSARQSRLRAAELARAGDYGRAIAALFSAALATLDERTIVAFDATRTPGEYRRLVRRERGGASEPFNDLAGRFVRAAYAQTETTAADYAAAERAYATFEPATA